MAGELSKVVAEAASALPALHILQPVIQQPQMMMAGGRITHHTSALSEKSHGKGNLKESKGEQKEGKDSRSDKDSKAEAETKGVEGPGEGQVSTTKVSPDQLVGVGLGDAQLPVITNFSGEYVSPLTVGNAVVLLRINLVAADAESLLAIAEEGVATSQQPAGTTAGAVPRMANGQQGGGAGAPGSKPTTPTSTSRAPAVSRGTLSVEKQPQTQVSATLSVSGEDVRAATCLMLLDNATGKEVERAPSGRLYPCR